MELDRGSPDVLFEQLAELIRTQIESGELPPRRKLMTQDEMAEHYQVSRGTVLRATKILTDEGLLRFVPGKGLFSADPEVIERFRRSRSRKR
jgi:GntR family transcriptional regulator